jgi:phosphatidate cytidylyltransferase
VDEPATGISPEGRPPVEEAAAVPPDGEAPAPAPDESPGAAKPRISRPLRLRLLSAAIIVPLVIGVILWGGLPFLVTVVAIIVLGLREFYDIIEIKGLRPQRFPGYVGGALLGIVTYVGNEYWTNVLLTVVLLVVMILQLLKQDIAEAIGGISATFFGVFYVGWLMAHAILLRRMDEILRLKYGSPAQGPFWIGSVLLDKYLGIFLLIFCIAAVAGSDIGAYFVGRRFGRTKLAPRVSPNKTVEGAFGGLATGVLFGFLAWSVFRIWVFHREVLPIGQALVLSLVLSIFGVLGDLAESLIKRDAHAKDAGTLLPGMGGVLDRIDSNMVAFPVLYYYMNTWFFLRSLGG